MISEEWGALNEFAAEERGPPSRVLVERFHKLLKS
jgi:hypothetical protein